SRDPPSGPRAFGPRLSWLNCAGTHVLNCLRPATAFDRGFAVNADLPLAVAPVGHDSPERCACLRGLVPAASRESGRRRRRSWAAAGASGNVEGGKALAPETLREGTQT